MAQHRSILHTCYAHLQMNMRVDPGSWVRVVKVFPWSLRAGWCLVALELLHKGDELRSVVARWGPSACLSRIQRQRLIRK